MQDLCKRCGECCQYIDNRGNKKYCDQLQRLEDGTTICRIYLDRLGHTIYKDLKCSDRLEHLRFHRDCSYNVLIARKLGML